MKQAIILACMLLVVAACQPAPPEDDDLPTRVQIETRDTTTQSTPQTQVTTAQAGASDVTATSPAAATGEITTAVATATLALSPTIVPSNTPDAAAPRISTPTLGVVEEPVFSTLTPAPPGIIGAARPTSTGEPELLADVIITESQYENQLSRQLAAEARVEEVSVNFVPEGIEVTLTASGGSALSTGEFVVQFDLSEGSFNNILIIGGQTEITMEGGGEPSDTFLDVVTSDVIPAVLETFDTLLNNQLGEGQHNLENIVFQGDRMGVSLLVPQSSQQ